MRLADYDKLQLKLREYADLKASNGEIELANGILKAKCFIDQECTVIEEKQLNSGWIPVSERLPEVFNENTSETVLITDGDWIAMGFINNNQQWLFAECSNKGTDIDWTDIIAWQPLPEPYKGE